MIVDLVYFLQETHIKEKIRSDVDFERRGIYEHSQGNSNPRGMLTVFTPDSFDTVLLRLSEPDIPNLQLSFIFQFVAFFNYTKSFRENENFSPLL